MAARMAAIENKYGNYYGFFGVVVPPDAGGRVVVPAGREGAVPVAPAGRAGGAATGLPAL